MRKTLVLGLGNPLLTDDGVGLRVARELRARLAGRPDVVVEEDYWGGLRLMERMVGFDRSIVIDAICGGGEPGTIRCLGVEEMPTQHTASAHDATLSTALCFGHRIGAALPDPEDVLVVAVEAADVTSFGEECTPHRPASGRNGLARAGPTRRRTMISPERLRAYPYFAGASEESLRELAMVSEELTFQEGQVLFREDQSAERLYILIRGEVDIQYELNTGEHRTVDTVVAGDVLVWSALVRPYRTTALAIARRMSEVIAVDSRKLRELCESDRELGFSLMTEIAQATSHRLEGARVQLATRA